MKTETIVKVAILVSLSYVLSLVKILQMPLGGSITAMSMLCLVLVTYMYGVKVGAIAGAIVGLLNFFTNPYFLSVTQVMLDYILAFVGLSFGGFFIKKLEKLMSLYIIGVMFRYIFSVTSGMVFFLNFAPKNMNPIIYVLSYNFIYLFGEGVLTVLIIRSKSFKNILKVII